MKKYREIGEHMVVDPEVCFGKLTFKGTRVPVATVLTLMSQGDTLDDVMRSWPNLTREAICEALHLAGKALVEVCGGRPTDGDLEIPGPWHRTVRAPRRVRERVAR